jgi:hypothetical protein
MPDLAEIARRSGLSPRKIRYILDQGLLPVGKISSRGRGTRRIFVQSEAIAIALAAWMLEAGLKRALVRDCLGVLCQLPSGGSRGVGLMKIPLYRALAAGPTARVEVGDWSYVRVHAASSPGRQAFDTGWMPLGGQAVPSGYAPLVAVVLDIGQIGGKFAGPEPP